MLGTSVANASTTTITLTSTGEGGGNSKQLSLKAGTGVWTFTIAFNPPLSARRLFIDLNVKGVDVYSIHICNQQQETAGLCYFNQGTTKCDFVAPDSTGLPDFNNTPPVTCTSYTDLTSSLPQNIIASPRLNAGTYSVQVLLSDLVDTSGILSSVTVTIASP